MSWKKILYFLVLPFPVLFFIFVVSFLGASYLFLPTDFSELLAYAISISFLLVILFSCTEALWGYVGLIFISRDKKDFLQSHPKVTVIIPAYNEEKVIQASIESALKLDYANKEIVVVDDGSIDRTYEIAQTYADKITVLHKNNGGKASALNMGLQHSQSEFVLFTDADSVLDHDAIKEGLLRFQRNPRLAAVSAIIFIANTGTLLTNLQALEYLYSANFSKIGLSLFGVVPVVSGAGSLFRRDAINEVGGVPEDTCVEDTDLTLSVLANGWDTEAAMSMVSNTEGPSSVHDLIVQRYRWSRGFCQVSRKFLKRILDSEKIDPRLIALYIFFHIKFLILSAFNLTTLLLVLLGSLIIHRPLFTAYWAVLTIAWTCSLLGAYHFCRPNVRNFKQLLSVLPLSLLLSTVVDMVSYLAIMDELVGIPMRWGLLRRDGGHYYK